MPQIFRDENNSCQIDFSKAVWATDQLHDIFHSAKVASLHDVDFIAETEDKLLLVEYKNANLPDAANPCAFKPWEDKKLNNVAAKYYDSMYFLQAIERGRYKRKIYVYILECQNGDMVLRNQVKALLAGRLPFLLQKQNALSENMIDRLEVVSVVEWNEKYVGFPLKLLKST